MNVRLKKTLHFTAGVWHDNQLHMNNYTLQVHLHTNTVSAVDQNTAFTRMQYFVYNALDSAVFINQDCPDQVSLLLQCGVRVVTVPGHPVDQMIGIMAYYKLNAIMQQRMIVTELEIHSDLGDNMVYMHNDQEDLVEIAKPEWCTRADPLHCDIAPTQSGKIVALNRDCSWRDLDLEWADHANQTDTANVVVFADFKRDDTE